MSTTPVDSAELDAQLPGWDYADAFDVNVDGTVPDSALAAARCLLEPGGGRLLGARDLLVRPAGLKPAVTGADDPFPVVLDTPQLAVLGLDDLHLVPYLLARTARRGWTTAVDSGRARCTFAGVVGEGDS